MFARAFRLAAFAAAALCLAFATAPRALADDAAAAKAVEALGGQVTLADGAVTRVSFRDCSKLGAGEFKLIGSLSKLKSLTLYGKCHGLTDDTLPLLHTLTELEELGTDGIALTDDGFKHFAGLPKLRSLSLFHVSFQKPGFTGAGFAHLKNVPTLRRLTYGGTTAGDQAAAALVGATQLRELRYWHTFDTPAAAESLAKMTHLTSLQLGQRLRRYDGKPNPPSLSDATIPALAKLLDLESLQLDEARLSHAGLKSLQALTKLKTLTLKMIDIAPGDLDKLKAELPNVKVVFTPMTAEEKAKLDAMLK